MRHNITPCPEPARRQTAHLDVAFLKSLAEALPNLCQQRRERHRESHDQEELAHHRLADQAMRHRLPAAHATPTHIAEHLKIILAMILPRIKGHDGLATLLFHIPVLHILMGRSDQATRQGGSHLASNNLEFDV